MKGKLYIIPIPIAENTIAKSIPSYNIELIKDLRFFVVEKVKTARQFLRKIISDFPIDDSTFYELNKHNDYSFESEIFKKLDEGFSVGVMSESGYPGIADPGNKVITKAHQNGIHVSPLIGPSSIFLALASSGLNGQKFTFHGYLPKNESERFQKIKDLNQEIQKNGFAQIFIETPYRNHSLFSELIKYSNPLTKLTVAMDITGEKEYIKTAQIKDWDNLHLKWDKYPCVFILG